jgi:hypothetical protein
VKFTADAHPGLADGSTTVTFRTWRRPMAKVGGRYRVGGMVLEVDRLEQVAVGTVDDADARRAGEADRAALIRRLARQAGTDVSARTKVWRVEFHRSVEAEAEAAIEDLGARAELTEHDVVHLIGRLDRMDRSSSNGPWTRAALRLIADHPAVVSTKLAADLGRERFSFKADIRKLKALGLTRSLEVGYELSPRGWALLARIDHSRRSGLR